MNLTGNALACLVREAREEAGLVIDPADVDPAHVVHVVDTSGGQPLTQMVFRARRWKGVPEVREADKCLAWQWWPRGELPEPIAPTPGRPSPGSPKAAHIPRWAGDRGARAYPERGRAKAGQPVP
ncbi:NUDIX domain-containing protein [Streptomyces sp. NPDC048106]|uniref:NUDIX domain-containing protein n=1 Tax=Streptomyces sp. NPDC048106 TaxID=3155750 RepID=UPI0034529AEF